MEPHLEQSRHFSDFMPAFRVYRFIIVCLMLWQFLDLACLAEVGLVFLICSSPL